MKNGKKLLLLLLVLVVLVGATAIVGTISKNAADQEDETQTVFSLDPENVTNLGWDYSEKVSFTAGEDGWVCDQDGAFPVEEAFQDPQAGALSEYIGKEEVTCDYTRMPFLLQPEDALLLCSDGVSDTLTLKQIREAMALSSQACCDKLEEEILAAGKPGQDNYTAIALKYHGKNKEES